MIQTPIEHELRQVAARFRQRRLMRNLAVAWWLALGAAAAVSLAARSTGLPWPGLWLLVASLSVGAGVFIVSWFTRRDLRWVARQIEQVHPDLQTKLLAAYESEARTPAAQRGYLDTAVIQQARLHAFTHEHWRRTVPTRQLFAWSALQWSALVALIAFLASQAIWTPRSIVAASATSDAVAKAVPAAKLEFTVEPGNVELERGTDLVVLARFAERDNLPREVTLSATDSAGQQRHAMQQSLSDPIYAYRVPEVRQDITYQVSFANQQSAEYRVTVFDYPELERADAELTYPDYTGLPMRRVEDVRQLSVLQGTELRLICRLNKPVASARLLPAEGEPTSLTATADDPMVYAASQRMGQSVRWRLELVDDRGRKNRQPIELVIEVLPNRPPDLKLAFPKRDVQVSPLQELPLEATVSDDFGVLRWGVSYELTGQPARSITWGEKLTAKEKHSGAQLVALEDLQAKPDELLAWHVWAEDVGPDGKTRRTQSDIFFAEVSPFEEIFREGSSDGSPGQGQPNPVDGLAKLQKEIITASWNLHRRESADRPSDKYVTDAQVIADSQQKALGMLAELREKLTSADAGAIVDQIEQHMQGALRELTVAVVDNALAGLDQALPEEQAAYQGLLRLRARETRVMRSRSSQGGGGQSASGQNLDQLELSNEQDRYETRSRAGEPQQTPAQREQEEFLKRLRELARRQEDLNQKIKELQAALDAARSDEERKQIERQLKRLRDEQRDLLRDTDQLKNQLDQPKHSEPLVDASRQLEQTRENVRQAADALQQGETSKALAAGTRAENELDKLREDFRKQTANQFADEVRDLVDRARALDERQQKIGEQFNDKKRPAQAGLRAPAAEASNLPDALSQQRAELKEVIDQARQLTERTEATEPLLSKQLYDTIRQTHQQQTERALELTQQLVAAGVPGEAAKVEPRAREGVHQLRQGIERAAEGVLGGDVESLRRAKREVDQLARALEDEIAKENPAAAPQKNNSSSQPGQQPSNDQANGHTPSQPGSSTADGQKQQPGQPGAESKQPGQGQQAGQREQSGQGEMPNDSKKPGEGQQPGQGKPAQAGQQPGQGQPAQQGQQGQSGQQGEQGQQASQGQQSGKGEQQSEGQGSGEGQGNGRSPQAARSPGLRSNNSQQQQPGNRPGDQPGNNNTEMAQDQPGSERGQDSQPGQGGERTARGNRLGSGPHGVISGPDWREWSDALRNVEEFVPGTRLRSEAARIREQAQAIRAESKRHSKAPNWELVRETVYEPLVELQRQLNEELIRRASPEAAVPLDRDPVPDRFGDAVRRYYERLGSGQ